MAVTSLWRVRGSLNRLIMYASNDKKTEIIETDNDDRDDNILLKDILDYAQREDATLHKKYVSGINCSSDNACFEMMKVKNDFGKTGGTVAYHGYLSFSKDELTPDEAHHIGVELATKLWAEKKLQVLVTTHIDKESHLHCHFVINTVPVDGGKKFHRTKDDYREMQNIADEICREHGLSVIEKPKGKRISYDEYMQSKNGVPTKNEIIKRDITECMKESLNFETFLQKMEKLGYTFDFSRTYTTISHPDFAKPRRLKTLGEEFSIPRIRNAIERRMYPEYGEYVAQDDTDKIFNEMFLSYEWPHMRFIYSRYTFEIKHWIERPAYNKYKLYLIKDDIKKLDKLIDEQDVLILNDIDCYEKLEAFISKCDAELIAMNNERQKLRNKLKTASVKNPEQAEELKSKISDLSEAMKKVRHDKKICEDVKQRAPEIEAKVKSIEAANEKIRKEKEEKTHESGRRVRGRDR